MPWRFVAPSPYGIRAITQTQGKLAITSEGPTLLGKTVRFVAGMAIGAGLLYLTLRDVSWQDIESELAHIAYGWILFALVTYWCELALRIVRWRVLLAGLQPPVAGDKVTMAFLSGYAVNNVLPAKLGEPFRADLLGRLGGVSRLSAFGSIIVERMFDMLMVLGMTAWGVLMVSSLHADTLADVNRGLVALFLPVLVAAAGLYFLATRKENVLVVKLKSMSEKLSNLIVGLEVPEGASSYVKLVSTTLVIWLLNSIAMWCILRGLDVHLGVGQTIMLIGLTGISAAIPAAPAGIGTLQYAFYLAAVLFDFAPSAAVVAAAIVQIVLLGSATLLGAAAYSRALSRYLLKPAGATQ